MNILVIAAHPDDEALGMGGTIRKLAYSNKIHLCIISEGASAQYNNKKMIEVRRDACIRSGKILGISTFDFLDFPDMQLDTISHLEINIAIEKIIKKYHPNTIFTTPDNDVNIDHRQVFESTLVATRPFASSVKQIFCYEIPNDVVTQFSPNVYYDITKEFKTKIKAINSYKTEIRKFPHPRSIKSLENLATFRGIQSGLIKAEAFRMIRHIID